MSDESCKIETLESRLLMAVVSVLNTNNDGAGSLRAAIAAAAAGDTIDLTGVTGTITLASQLSVDRDVTLRGPGRNLLTLSGNDAVRVMYVKHDVRLHMST